MAKILILFRQSSTKTVLNLTGHNIYQKLEVDKIKYLRQFFFVGVKYHENYWAINHSRSLRVLFSAKIWNFSQMARASIKCKNIKRGLIPYRYPQILIQLMKKNENIPLPGYYWKTRWVFITKCVIFFYYRTQELF